MSIHNAKKHMPRELLFVVVVIDQPKLRIFFYYGGLATTSPLKIIIRLDKYLLATPSPLQIIIW
jgi:hypothetical protein